MGRRVLLDENLGYRFGKRLGEGFVVESTRHRGWAGTSNGELLALAEADFDVLMTRDGNLSYQNRIHDRDIAVVVLRGKDLGFDRLLAQLTIIRAALRDAPAGHVTELMF